MKTCHRCGLESEKGIGTDICINGGGNIGIISGYLSVKFALCEGTFYSLDKQPYNEEDEDYLENFTITHPWFKGLEGNREDILCDNCIEDLIVKRYLVLDKDQFKDYIPIPVYSYCCDKLITNRDEIFSLNKFNIFPYRSMIYIHNNTDDYQLTWNGNYDFPYAQCDNICRECLEPHKIYFTSVNYFSNMNLDFQYRENNYYIKPIYRAREIYEKRLKYLRDNSLGIQENVDQVESLILSLDHHEKIKKELLIYFASFALRNILKGPFKLSKDVINHLLSFV